MEIPEKMCGEEEKNDKERERQRETERDKETERQRETERQKDWLILNLNLTMAKLKLQKNYSKTKIYSKTK